MTELIVKKPRTVRMPYQTRLFLLLVLLFTFNAERSTSGREWRFNEHDLGLRNKKNCGNLCCV